MVWAPVLSCSGGCGEVCAGWGDGRLICAQLCFASATHTSHLCGALALPQGPGGVAVELLGSREPVA